jgi:hypothetical protein
MRIKLRLAFLFSATTKMGMKPREIKSMPKHVFSAFRFTTGSKAMHSPSLVCAVGYSRTGRTGYSCNSAEALLGSRSTAKSMNENAELGQFADVSLLDSLGIRIMFPPGVRLQRYQARVSDFNSTLACTHTTSALSIQLRHPGFFLGGYVDLNLTREGGRGMVFA